MSMGRSAARADRRDVGLRSRAALAVLLLGAAVAEPAVGAGATRALPDLVPVGGTFPVTITLDPPPGTLIAAAEDAPPSGWTVSNISDSGSFDSPSGKVKWGLFIAPSIPATLTYDVTRQASPAPPCFSGTAAYDGGEFPIAGDACMVAVPAVSAWGLLVLSLSLVTVGTRMAMRRRRIDA